MGVRQISLVAPEFELDHPDIAKRACGNESLLHRKEVYPDLPSALKKSHVAVGATRRIRYQKNRQHWHPRELREWMEGQGKKIKLSLVFGPEDAGLSNEDLSHCQKIVTIPTHKDFVSINLAQSVMILLYELSLAQWDPQEFQGAKREGLATITQLEAFYDHWERSLAATGFLDPQNPYRAMNQFREFFGRAQPTAREVALFRALCGKILLTY